MLLLALFLPGDAATNLLERYEAFQRSAKSFSVKIDSSVDGQLYARAASVQVQKPGNLLFKLKTSGADYVYCLTPAGGLEIENTERTYIEHAYAFGLAVRGSELSEPVENSLPRAITFQSLRSYLPDNAQYTSEGKTTLRGVSVEKLRGFASGNGGQSTLVAWLDGDGKLLKVVFDTESPMGSRKLDMDLYDWVVNKPHPAGLFNVKPPKGFTPFGLPPVGLAVEMGETLRFGSWRSNSGETKNLDNLISQSKSLVVIAAPDCAPSAKLLQGVASLVPKGVRLHVLSSGAGSLPTKSFYLPPKSFAVPATPMMYLLDTKGVVIQGWMGFDSSKKNALAKELAEAAAREPEEEE